MKIKLSHIIAIGLFALLILTYTSFNKDLDEQQNNYQTLKEEKQKEINALKDDVEALEGSLDLSSNGMNDLLDDVKFLNEMIEKLENENNQLVEVYAPLLEDRTQLYNFVSSFHDVEDPESILNDLMKRPELIGIEAVLGGTMQYGKPIFVSPFTVYAGFSDGHIQGGGLYSFEVLEDGTINWTTLYEGLE